MRSPLVVLVYLAVATGGCGRIGFDSICGSGPCGGLDSVAGSPYAAAVVADHPIAYFRFDEPSGPTAHSVIGSTTGTYQGSFVFGAGGAVGDGDSSVTFDGSTTRIDLGDAFPFGGTTVFSIEVWIRPQDVVNTRFVVNRTTNASPTEGYSMYLGDTFFLFARQTNGTEFGYVTSGQAPALDTWTYAVLTFDGTDDVFYLDTAVIQDDQGSGMAIGGGPGHFVVGDHAPAQFNKFNGEIDELAIYDHALTPAEITAHYRASGR